MNRYALLRYAGLALACLSLPAQAGVTIGGTRVVYPGDGKEATVTVSSPEKSGVYLVQSWVDAGEKTSRRAPFIVTPPLFRLDDGGENILRIVQAGGALPQDRESVFWLNVKAIPALDDSQPHEDVLQVVVKSRIKLFYRPAGLSGEAETAYRQLTAARQGGRLVLSNPTPYYVTLLSLKVNGRELKEADMVPPKGSAAFPLPAGAATVSWQAINDYGGISDPERRKL